MMSYLLDEIIENTRIKPQAEYAIAGFFYATDRNTTGETKPVRTYGNERSINGQVALGSCDVSIPRDHRVGRLEAPSILKLQFREDPTKHVVLLKVSPQAEEKFYSQLSERVRVSERKEAFVFIHGFNVTFEDAARRTAQMSYDLAFDRAPIFYSWPSKGKLESVKTALGPTNRIHFQ